MQNSSIELKSSKYTLTIVMDPSAPFEQILADITQKFTSGARFFKGAQMALEFRGKLLTQEEQFEAAAAITNSCGLDIVCILEKDEEKEEAQYRAIRQVLEEAPGKEEAKDRESTPSSEEDDPFTGMAGSADLYRGS